MTTSHIGDDAALYALGLLDDNERAAIDAHAATCAACAQLLAQACDDVTHMVEATSLPPANATRTTARRPARWQYAMSGAWLPAIAAAILIFLLPSAYLLRENIAMHDTMVAESQAMERMASSPYRAVAFNGMDAKVMYGTDGSWYCVVVHGAKAPVDVAWMHDGTKTMLGTAVPHGEVAVLYLPKSHRMDQLALVTGDRMMGQAQLIF